MLGELRDTDAASDRSSVTGDINVFHRCRACFHNAFMLYSDPLQRLTRGCAWASSNGAECRKYIAWALDISIFTVRSSSGLPAPRHGGGGSYAEAHAGSRHADDNSTAAAERRRHPPGAAASAGVGQGRADATAAAAAEQLAADAARQLAAATAQVQELQQDRQQLERLAAERDQVCPHQLLDWMHQGTSTPHGWHSAVTLPAVTSPGSMVHCAALLQSQVSVGAREGPGL